MRQRQPRVIDEAHRKFIGGLPCIICGNDIETQAAHVAYADLRYGKPFTPMAGKASDFYCVPLCKHHTEQHSQNERAWWDMAGIDPIPVALALYVNSGNQEAGEQIVSAWKDVSREFDPFAEQAWRVAD